MSQLLEQLFAELDGATLEWKVTDREGTEMAIKTQVINVVIVRPNDPPQYTGPTTINDLVVGVTRQLQGMDPDGDQITWTMDPSPLATISTSGVLTPTQAGTGAITVHLDDGKP